jgi:hypothetical protein
MAVLHTFGAGGRLKRHAAPPAGVPGEKPGEKPEEKNARGADRLAVLVAYTLLGAAINGFAPAQAG